MWRWFIVLLSGNIAAAGVHYSGETPAPLPSQWRGYLLEQRALRMASVPPAPGIPANTLREQYEEAVKKLTSQATKEALLADELADLGALYIRLGQPAKAIDVLRPAQRQHPTHFRIHANLGTSWHLHGDLAQATRTLEEAVRLAPEQMKRAEEAHLRLVRLRAKEPKQATTPDNVFGVNLSVEKLAPEERKKLPADDVAVVQQLALWLPGDARLLWLLGELCHVHGDDRTAVSIMEGVVTELALTTPLARERRQRFRTLADNIAKLPDAEHAKYKGDIVFVSTRPVIRIIDLASLPAIRATGVNPVPWLVFNETTIAKPFQPKFLKHLEQLDGKKVSLTGFMQPLSMDVQVAGFLLVEHPIGCWFCETPEPSGLLFVEMRDGKSAPVKRTRIKIEGTLKLNKTDAEDFLYTITGALVGEPD